MRIFRRLCPVLIAAALVSACAVAEPAAHEVPTYTIDQFMETVRISTASLSSDGETVLFTSDASGVPNAYAVPYGGGEPVQLTHSQDAVRTLTDRERLRRISPLFHADRITKPFLVLQGANDRRVLQQESDDIVAAARANGVPVEYIVFPDEGHGFLKKENRRRAYEAVLGFLDRHLAPGGEEVNGEG